MPNRTVRGVVPIAVIAGAWAVTALLGGAPPARAQEPEARAAGAAAQNVQEVLTSLAERAGRAILVDDAVSGRIAAQLPSAEDLSDKAQFEALLALLCAHVDCVYGTIGSVYVVAPRDPSSALYRAIVSPGSTAPAGGASGSATKDLDGEGDAASVTADAEWLALLGAPETEDAGPRTQIIDFDYVGPTTLCLLMKDGLTDGGPEATTTRSPSSAPETQASAAPAPTAEPSVGDPGAGLELKQYTPSEVFGRIHIKGKRLAAATKGDFFPDGDQPGSPPQTLPLLSASVDATILSDRVIVTGSPAAIEAVRQFIRAVDRAPVQVMIESMIVETVGGTLRDYGISMQQTSQAPNPGATPPVPGAAGWSIGTSDTNLLTAADGAAGLLSYASPTGDLVARLMALVEQRRASIRANPCVVAQDRKAAVVWAGSKKYMEVSGTTFNLDDWTRQIQVAYAGTNLYICPSVSDSNREVTCQITASFGEPVGDFGGSEEPVVDIRFVATTVRVQDGGVIAIGGLVREVEQRTERRVPVLAEIPLLGHLFRSTSKQKTSSEVVILVVPHILNEDGTFAGQLLSDRITPDSALYSASPRTAWTGPPSESPAAGPVEAPTATREDPLSMITRGH